MTLPSWRKRSTRVLFTTCEHEELQNFSYHGITGAATITYTTGFRRGAQNFLAITNQVPELHVTFLAKG